MQTPEVGGVCEGLNRVCFGWGTVWGRAAEGAETERQRPVNDLQLEATTVSLWVKQEFKCFNVNNVSSYCNGDR